MRRSADVVRGGVVFTVLRGIASLAAIGLLLTKPFPSLAQEDLAQARTVLEEALREAQAIGNDAFRTATLGYVAGVRAVAGDTAGALRIAAGVQEEQARGRILHLIALARARNGDPLAGTTLPRDDVLFDVAGIQVNQGKILEAQRTAAAIAQDGMRQSAVALIVEAQLKAGDLAGGEQSARTLKDVLVRNRALHGVAVAQAVAGDVPAALRTLQAFSGTYLKDEALRAIVVARARSGAVAEALLIAIEGHAVPRFSPEYAVALGKMGATYEAERMRIEWSLWESAAAQARAGQVMAALQTIAAMTPPSELPGLVIAIASARAQTGDAPGTLDIVSTINYPLSASHVFRDLAIAQASAGDTTAALGTVARVVDPDQADEARLQIVISQARRGDLSAARATAGSIKNPRRRTQAALEGIADAHLQAGDIPSAILAIAGVAGRPEHGRIVLQKIAVAQARNGDTDAALQTASRLREPETTFRDVAVARAQTGDLPGAEKALAQQSERWKAHTVRRIAAALARAGYAQKAYPWATAQPSPQTRAFALLGVADGILQRAMPSYEPW